MFLFSQNRQEDKTKSLQQEIHTLKVQLEKEHQNKMALKEELESKQDTIESLQQDLEQKADAFCSSQETLENLEKNFTHLQHQAKSALNLSHRFQDLDSTNPQEELDSKMETLLQSTSAAVHSIQTLNSDLSNVSEFISLIKEISDQTGLLAMNASIEAARAGDEGRGFSIVADEVNKLSDKTQKAVMDIKVIIDSIHKSMEEAEQNITQTATELDHFTENEPSNMQREHLHTQLLEEIQTISEQINTISNKHV